MWHVGDEWVAGRAVTNILNTKICCIVLFRLDSVLLTEGSILDPLL